MLRMLHPPRARSVNRVLKYHESTEPGHVPTWAVGRYFLTVAVPTVAYDFSFNEIDDVFGDIGRVVSNAFQMPSC